MAAEVDRFQERKKTMHMDTVLHPTTTVLIYKVFFIFIFEIN